MSETSKRETRANRSVLRGARISPMKVRPVIDLIRNQPVEVALEILGFTPKKAAGLLTEMIESALANVYVDERLDDWDADHLYVAEAYVNEGPTLRRFRPRAQGRAGKIAKRTSHITVILKPQNKKS